jgi:phage gp29-like protein
MLHDVRQIEPTLSAQLVKPIALINGLFPENRLPTWKYLTEETVDQGKMADVLQKSVDMGMEIDLDYAHQVMQIPRAKDGAKLLSRSAAPAPNAGDEGEEGLMREVALANESPDIASAYSAQMAATCAPFEERVIAQIAEIVAESSDFDEALEKIAAMKRDEKNYQAWAQTLAEGMAAANLAGRAAVQGSK